MSEPQNTTLPTQQLQPNPFQPRGKIASDDISELKQSVAQYGILEPLVVALTPAGYQIIAGERRWRAARELGLEEVPVHIKKTSPRGMLEMAIVENVQRVDLTPIERAQAFQQLIRDFNFTMQEIADKIGKSGPYISNTLKLLNLPDAIKDGLVGGMITEGHARAIGGIKDEKYMIECYKTILRRNSSVREAEELARRYKSESGQEQGLRGRGIRIEKKEYEEWTINLQKLFRPKSKVKLTRSNQQTKVTFVFPGDIYETQADLDKILRLSRKKLR
jgi:ParB family chromosome partitioning protein